jgi:hypothetical protein
MGGGRMGMVLAHHIQASKGVCLLSQCTLSILYLLIDNCIANNSEDYESNLLYPCYVKETHV